MSYVEIRGAPVTPVTTFVSLHALMTGIVGLKMQVSVLVSDMM